MGILLGIQAEVMMRTYYETQHKTTYLLHEIREGIPAESSDSQLRHRPGSTP